MCIDGQKSDRAAQQDREKIKRDGAQDKRMKPNEADAIQTNFSDAPPDDLMTGGSFIRVRLSSPMK